MNEKEDISIALARIPSKEKKEPYPFMVSRNFGLIPRNVAPYGKQGYHLSLLIESYRMVYNSLEVCPCF